MKNQKGFAPIIILVVLVVIAGGVGYFMLNKNKPVINKSVTQSLFNLSGDLNPNCKYNDPDLCKYFNKSLKFEGYKDGFTGKTAITDKAGKKSETVFQFQNDRSHFSTKDNGKEIMESITIADTTYTKDFTDNKWWKYTREKTKADTQNQSVFNSEDIKKEVEKNFNEDKTTFTKIGKEACGKLQCFKYQAVNDLTNDSKEYVYFDDREYLLRKMRIEDKEGSITETEYEFGNVNITEPAPVKEMQAGQNPYFPGAINDQGGKIDAKELENTQKELEKTAQENK